jgi:hypothetical protein
MLKLMSVSDCRVREYQEKDLAALRAIHAAQGFDYALPDLSNPLFVTKLVLAEKSSDGEEKIAGAALLRLTAEAYLLLDPRAGSSRERWQRLRALHDAAQRDVWLRGLEDVHAWLPPPIGAKFGKHIERLGWVRDDAWTPYCKKLVSEIR